MADEFERERENETSRDVSRSVLKLDILGTSFTITADEDKAYLDEVFKKYRTAVENTQKISGIKDPLNVAILTGFILCDEYKKTKDELDAALRLNANNSGNPEESDDMYAETAEDKEVEDRTLRLISKLEHALNIFGNEKNI